MLMTVDSRAKLFRFASNEWKERGTGDVKFLKHKESGKTRIVMRRDQTLKVCANHYSIQARFPGISFLSHSFFHSRVWTFGMATNSCIVTPEMVLKENIGSDRSWVYSTTADMSDGVATGETLAIRFGNSDSTPPTTKTPSYLH